jgi:uncharacterized protein (DUF2147 family)
LLHQRLAVITSFGRLILLDCKRRSPLALQSAKLVMAGLLTLAAAAIHPVAAAPEQASVAGLWQKIDEETGKSVGWFLFVEQDGAYQGVFAKLFKRASDGPTPPVCSACDDERKDQPLLGLPFIRHMKRHGLKYTGGDILDPRDGNVYQAEMTVSPDGQTLTVHGFLFIPILGKDEIWHRLPDTAVKELDPTVVTKYLPAQNGATGSIPPQGAARSANRAR